MEEPIEEKSLDSAKRKNITVFWISGPCVVYNDVILVSVKNGLLLIRKGSGLYIYIITDKVKYFETNFEV